MITTEAATAGLFTLAAQAPFQIAPERAGVLAAEALKDEGWEIRPSSVEAFFAAIVEDRRIYLSYAGLASLWCLAYAGFHTMDVASRIAADPAAKDVGSIDLGQLWSDYRLWDFLDFARRLCVEDEPWPTGLPTPQPAAPLDTENGRVNNLFFAALSWVMLHEIGHIHHLHSRFLGQDLKLGQEWQADRFATSWILQDAQGDQREFRVLAIAVAQAWLLLFEQARQGGGDHPPAILRFREAASWFDVPEDSPGLENASYLLKAIFDPTTPMPEGLTARQAFDWVEDRLVAIIPRTA